MKFVKVTTLIAMTVALTSATAVAQFDGRFEVRTVSQRAPAQKATDTQYSKIHDYYAQDEAKSSTDAPKPPADVASMGTYSASSCDDCGCEADCGCECDCDCDCCCDECHPGHCYFGLFHNCDHPSAWEAFSFLDDSSWNTPGIRAGGWLNGGIYGNAYGADNNGPLGTLNLGDGWQVNQMWGFLEVPLNAGEGEWGWGFRCDYVFGTDGPDTQAFGDLGWDFGWNSNTRANGVQDYGSAIPQLYAELGYGNFGVKLGHFYTIAGYEVIPATGNFFYSHAYTFYYGEPFTHTGGLATWALNDSWTVYGGWTLGWDSGWENDNDAGTYLGGVSWTISEYTSLAWVFNTGDFGDGTPNPANVGDIYMNSIVFQQSLTDRLTWVLHHDLGSQELPSGMSNQWYSIVNYLFYEINGCWSVGGRFEWFDDANGSRVADVGGTFNGAAGDYYEATLGVNYRPHANFVVRPEVRWDWFVPQGPTAQLPFKNGTRDNQFSGGVDMIFTF